MPFRYAVLSMAFKGDALDEIELVREGMPYLGRVVSNLLDVIGHLLDNLLVTLLVVLGLSSIHLVEGDNELLHSQSVGQKSVLAGLPILGDTCAEERHNLTQLCHSNKYAGNFLN